MEMNVFKRNSLIIITGCDSGIGKALTGLLLEKNFSVLISYLEKNPFPPADNLYACHLDLREEKSIVSFADYARNLIACGMSLFSLVNNAGIAKGGPVENVPLSLFREVMEVNFFGLVALTKEMIPSLILSKGKLVIHGSMAGRIALPFLSPYTSSKFALEGFTDSLRRELNPCGVKTVLLNTAGVATPIWNKAKVQDISNIDRKYLGSLKEFREKFIETGNSGLDSLIAAKKIYRIIIKKNPAPRYVIAKSRIVSKLEMMIPARIFDFIVRKLFSMDYGL